MAAKLENCTEEVQRFVISFLWAEGVPGGQIHQHMCAQYVDNALSRKVVYEWIEMFKTCRTSETDAERSGHPTTATTALNEERARELILQNRRVTVDEIAKQLNISIGSAYSVVHDNLQFHRVCARWVPKELEDEHKHELNQPETKGKSMQWKHLSPPAANRTGCNMLSKKFHDEGLRVCNAIP
jgi:transposase